MTVYSEVNKITYIGSSEQTLYPIPFEYINNDNIVVSIYSSDNEPLETWTYSTEYVVEGNNVRVLEGHQIDNSKKMLIERKLDIVQDNKYREGGDFPAKSTETSFDKLTMIAQQQKDELSRCPKVDSVYDVNITLPAPEAGKALIWNENENGFRNSMAYVDELEAQTKEYRDQAEASKNAAQSSEANAKSSELSAAQSAQSAADTVNGFDDHAAEKQSQFDINAASKTNTFNSNYTSKLNSFNTNAAQKQAQVDASAETARKWAVGTPQEQSQGSAKYWAEQAQIATDGTLNYTNITNCITAIPQDIKLELNNGTLTLKAGSKVYKGDGSPVSVNSDVVVEYGGQIENIVVFPGTSGTNTVLTRIEYCYSGTTPPSQQPYRQFWYDTVNRKVYTYAANSVEGVEVCLPIAVVDSLSDNKFSVKEVFNGFGYIGGTRFTLGSGVKVLAPNGRNPDGSLNSIEYTLNFNIFSNYGNNNTIYYTDGNGANNYSPYYEQSEKPSTSGLWYNPDDNYMRLSVDKGATWTIIKQALIGILKTDSTGRITSFNPKPVFQAQDYHTAARVDDDNVFTGNNTFSGTVNFEANRAVFKKTLTEGGEFLVEIPESKVDELGNYWHVDVNSNGNIRFFRTNGTVPKVVTSINAKTGVINYEVGTALSASDNSTQVPTTAWVRQFAVSIDWSQKIDISSVNFVTTGYTAPADGLITANIKPNNYTTLQWAVDGVETGIKWTTGEDRDWDSSCTYLPIKKGQKATIIGGDGANRGTYFTPY